MALQYSTTLRNAQLDQLETVVGTSPLLRLYTGTVPANCAAAATGTKLAEMTLPSDWMGAASGGVKSKSGTWSVAAIAAGTAGYWRLTDSAGTTTHAQGTVTGTGGGGDLVLDNPVLAVGQTVSVSTFDVSAGNS